jgi:hypothetical protein
MTALSITSLVVAMPFAPGAAMLKTMVVFWALKCWLSVGL